MADESTFKVKIRVPRWIRVDRDRLDRDSFYSWIWARFQSHGLVGVHEGTLLSEQAEVQGHGTDSWTLDSAEAPRERDWVGGQDEIDTELYFATREDAIGAAKEIAKLPDFKGLRPDEAVAEQRQQDWIAEWKASFQGAAVPPFWKVLPPWIDHPNDDKIVVLRINPGAGFGTGTHETTQLCLEAIGTSCQRDRSLLGQRVLDFGSGSGILAIGAALLGADVDAVEIDPLAVDNARENAELNSVDGKVNFSLRLGKRHEAKYPMVIANILKPVLLEFSPELVRRMAPKSVLILSGLIEKDVAPVSEAYSALLKGVKPEVRALNEWRALVFRTLS